MRTLAIPLVIATACSSHERGASYLGSASCGACHPAEYVRWINSHHARAMQPARDDTVRGDFHDAALEVRGKRWRFSRDGERFVVDAEGPDGELHAYPVEYTFGVEPLQQYLVPASGGRLQALSVAWDVERARWFSLAGGRDIAPADWLHWTGGAQRWNSMCADCHSTNVTKGYDAASDSFHTTTSELAVGCEACHGPGGHRAGDVLVGRAQVDRCAPCHARRAQLADGGPPGAPMLDRYLPALLEPGVFHADGQILDEDFEVQSFTQSKMYARGVACGDCHDVHSGKLRASGNTLCTRCHDAKAFDGPAHHAHAGARCVSCHMPGRTYMVVHVRRDHSLRVPQPGLATGAPNACAQAGCHADRSPAWIASAYDAIFGRRARANQPHWGTALAAARAGAPEAATALVALAGDPARPAIARATALALLSGHDDPAGLAVLARGLDDADPLIRHAATTGFTAHDPAELAHALAPRLADPIRAVRLAAVARLAELPAQLRATMPAFAPALDEYIATQRYMSDLPSGPFDLGNVYAALGRTHDAEREYRRALAIDARFVQAKVNLALLIAPAGRTGEAERLLRSVRRDEPGFATAAFDLALLLAEQGQRAAAEHALDDAIAADPTLAGAVAEARATLAR